MFYSSISVFRFVLPDGKIVIRASITNGEWSFSHVILGRGCELMAHEKCAVCPGKSFRFAGCFSNGDKPVERTRVSIFFFYHKNM